MQTLPAVSKNVDGCKRMIFKSASAAYQRISQDHKRFIDLEDVQQEGLIAAWLADQKFDPNFVSKGKYKQTIKYSTYLVTALRDRFSGAFHMPLKQQKRNAARVAELDAPITAGEDDSLFLADSLPSADPTPEDITRAVEVFASIARRLSPLAAEVFVRGLLVGEWDGIRSNRMRGLLREMRIAAHKSEASFEDLVPYLQNANFRTRALQISTQLTNMTLGNGMTAQILECIECGSKFSLASVTAGRYDVETFTCRSCMVKMQKAPALLSCFGKVKTETSEGYDQNDVECRLHCRDRHMCKRFINQERGSESMSAKNAELEELNDVPFDDEEEETTAAESVDVDAEEAPAKTTAKKTATKKSAKKPAAKKAAKPAAKKTAVKKAAAPAKKEAKPATKTAKKTSTPAKKTTAKKAAKPEKATKAQKAAKGIKLDEKGRDLPFKPNSGNRYSLECALEGVSLTKLRKSLTEGGYNADFQIKKLLSGDSGYLMPYPTTHVWKIERSGKDGDFVRAYDVKRVATFDRLPRKK